MARHPRQGAQAALGPKEPAARPTADGITHLAT